jgi:hypothetical protein
MWNRRVAKGNCVAARRGGEQPGANNSAQNSISMRLNSIRPDRQAAKLRRKRKPVAQAMLLASPKHINEATSEHGRVCGVSGVGKLQEASHEICSGAKREPNRSQSLHSSEEVSETRWSEGR